MGVSSLQSTANHLEVSKNCVARVLTVLILRRHGSALRGHRLAHSLVGGQASSWRASLRPSGGAMSPCHIGPRPVHPPFHPIHRLEALHKACPGQLVQVAAEREQVQLSEGRRSLWELSDEAERRARTIKVPNWLISRESIMPCPSLPEHYILQSRCAVANGNVHGLKMQGNLSSHDVVSMHSTSLVCRIPVEDNSRCPSQVCPSSQW